MVLVLSPLRGEFWLGKKKRRKSLLYDMKSRARNNDLIEKHHNDLD
jgi:hypothetical protein